MYKNNINKPQPDCHRWGPEGANEPVLEYLLGSRKGKEDPEVTREKFEGSHTYLWLLEAGSCAPRGFKEIIEVFESEEKDGVTGFVNSLLKLYKYEFDIPLEED